MNTKQTLIFSALILSFAAAAQAPVMESRSAIDWTKSRFVSSVTLDVEAAGIPMPSGKNTAINRINMQLPILIKDPLLGLQVDSANTIGDLVLNESITLEQLTKIIDGGKKTPGVFLNATSQLSTKHTMDLQSIGAGLIKHRYAYVPRTPIKTIASKPFTGIIIDARGLLPVHGEYVRDIATPCFFPKIWNESMELLYEKNMMEPEKAKASGVVVYDYSNDESRYIDRIGINPLHITARQIFGANRTDPVISNDDALKILTVPENRELLQQGRIVILLDEDQLVHDVAAPERTRRHYEDYTRLRKLIIAQPIPDIEISDGPGNGAFKILVNNLQFVADSSKLLDSEKSRFAELAANLLKINVQNGYTILVEGHTADVNKPDGQMQLSVERAKSIIDALAAQGIDRSLFTYKGYGGTKPVASNDTAEGRAQNRRVEIIVMPRASFVQRAFE